MPLALKVGCPSSGAGCDKALVFIFLCVGLMAFFVVLRLTPVSFPLMCILFLPEDGRTTEICSSISSKINLR
jgi:hypothetical protein